MLYEIKKRRVGIPTELYLKIKKFIEEELRPVVYEYNRIFIPITYEKDKLGSFARDGVFEMYDEDALDQFRLNYFKRLGELADKIEVFGMNEIYPILMG